MALLRAGWLAVLLCAGCAQALSFNECTTNADCAGRAGDGGARLFCTDDHFCVNGLPDSQICTPVAGDMTANALVVAILGNVGTVEDPNTHMMVQANDADLTITKAARLAIAEMNMRQAGASQPPIVAYVCDTANDSVQALKAAKRAVEFYKAAALIGPTTSDEVIALTAYVKSTGTLLISPSATSKEISNLDDGGLVWRTAPSDDVQMLELATRVKNAAAAAMGQPRVNTLYAQTIYSTGVNQLFVTNYGNLTGLGLHIQIPYMPSMDGIALDMAINTLAKDGPTHAVVLTDYDAANFLRKVKGQTGLDTTLFYFTDAAYGPFLFEGMPPADTAVLQRVRGTAPATPASSTYNTFRSSFIGQFMGTDPNFTAWTANAYDAAYLVGIAAGATVGHVPNGKDLATGLSRINQMGTPVAIGPTTYLDAVKQMGMGGVRLDGASGPLEFFATGDLRPQPGQYQFWCVDTSGMKPMFTNNCCVKMGTSCGGNAASCCSGMCDMMSGNCM